MLLYCDYFRTSAMWLELVRDDRGDVGPRCGDDRGLCCGCCLRGNFGEDGKETDVVVVDEEESDAEGGCMFTTMLRRLSWGE